MPDTSAVHDIQESQAWQESYGNHGIFQGDKRGLSLSLCTDGLNPFSRERVSYSMWPITLALLNLPRRVRMMFGSMMLVGIIPGKKEPQNTDIYLEVVVDELLQLYDSTVYDSYRNENFKLKTSILLHVLDYPGQNKVFHCQGMLINTCWCIHVCDTSGE